MIYMNIKVYSVLASNRNKLADQRREVPLGLFLKYCWNQFLIKYTDFYAITRRKHSNETSEKITSLNLLKK